MGVVAVLTGVVASGLTLGYDTLVAGQAPSLVQVGGMACAIGGAALSSRLGTVSPRVAALSLVGGCAFGGSFIAFNLAAAESPVTVLFVARLAAIVLLGGVWLTQAGRRLTLHPLIAVAGVLDTVANLLMLVAVTLVPVSLATAISSANPPIVTMLLARFVLGEGLPRLAYVSVGLACVGIGLSSWADRPRPGRGPRCACPDRPGGSGRRVRCTSVRGRGPARRLCRSGSSRLFRWKPAAAAASMASPSAAPTVWRGSSCVIPLTSLTICGQVAVRAPPPTATKRDAGGGPTSSKAVRLCRTPRATASRMARMISARPCDRVRPSSRPRACGSKMGVRSPAK